MRHDNKSKSHASLMFNHAYSTKQKYQILGTLIIRTVAHESSPKPRVKDSVIHRSLQQQLGTD